MTSPLDFRYFALLLANPVAMSTPAFARAQPFAFNGNPLWLIGIGVFVFVVLWLTIWTALRGARQRHGDGDGFYTADMDGDGHTTVFHR
jgi:type VI protein secretion system component VasK